MNHSYFKVVTAPAVVALALLLGGIGPGYADQLDQIHAINKGRTQQAQVSQGRVDNLDDERQNLLEEYKATDKVIAGLRVYNRQLERQLSAQDRRLGELEASIAQITEMKRQITPLMIRMLDALEQFVSLDTPFHYRERQQRLEFIKAALENPVISDAEKFRQVLEGYQIENEYGRKIDAYTDTVKINGADVNVNVLRVGRIALAAQTKDEKTTLVWDKTAGQSGEWVELPSAYRNPIRQGIRIARNQATIDMMMLPIEVPEGIQ